MRIYIFTFFFLLITAFNVVSQEASLERQARGSIPEALLRPARGESPRFPIDTVIGELGRGQAPQAAFNYAHSICDGLLSIDMTNSALTSIPAALRENLLETINSIEPLSFRLGGGREEADGAVSFLVRFLGKDRGISGELYLRRIFGIWTFEELLLDEAKDREVDQEEAMHRNDFNPYERFF